MSLGYVIWTPKPYYSVVKGLLVFIEKLLPHINVTLFKKYSVDSIKWV